MKKNLKCVRLAMLLVLALFVGVLGLGGAAEPTAWQAGWLRAVADGDPAAAAAVCLERLEADGADGAAWDALVETAAWAARTRRFDRMGLLGAFSQSRPRSDILGQLVGALGLLYGDRAALAEAQLKALAAAAPDDARIYGLLARLDVSRGRYAEAEKSVNLSLEINPFSISAMLTRVESAMGQGRFNSASDLLNQVVERTGPGWPATAWLRGLIDDGMSRTGQGVIRGRCLDADSGAPVEGAFVEVSAVVPGQGRRKPLGQERSYAAISNQLGRFEVRDVQPGTYAVRAVRRGQVAESSRLVRMARDEGTEPVSLFLTVGRTADILVVDAQSRRPVVAASVSLAVRDEEEARRLTDAAGTASFTSLFPQAYKVVTTAPGYMQETTMLTVRPARGEDAVRLVVELKKGVHLSGVVTDNHGLAMPEVKLYVCAAMREAPMAETQSLAGGRFVFESIEPGVTFRVVGHKPDTGFVMSGDLRGNSGERLRVDLKFQEPVELSGEVLDDDQQGLADCEVLVRLDAGLNLDPELLTVRAKTNELGMFETRPISPGRYSVLPIKTGYVSQGFRVIEVKPDTGHCVLRLEKAQRIAGSVADEEGRPVDGAIVYALKSNGIKSRTGADGAFVLDGLRPGTYDLLVIYKGYHSIRRTGVRSNTEGLRIALEQKDKAK